MFLKSSEFDSMFVTLNHGKLLISTLFYYDLGDKYNAFSKIYSFFMHVDGTHGSYFLDLSIFLITQPFTHI